MNSLNVSGCFKTTSSDTNASSSSCSSEPETCDDDDDDDDVVVGIKTTPVQTNTWDRLQKHKDDMFKQFVSARVQFQQEILQTPENFTSLMMVSLNVTKLFLEQNHQNITDYFFISFLSFLTSSQLWASWSEVCWTDQHKRLQMISWLNFIFDVK